MLDVPAVPKAQSFCFWSAVEFGLTRIHDYYTYTVYYRYDI